MWHTHRRKCCANKSNFHPTRHRHNAKDLGTLIVRCVLRMHGHGFIALENMRLVSELKSEIDVEPERQRHKHAHLETCVVYAKSHPRISPSQLAIICTHKHRHRETDKHTAHTQTHHPPIRIHIHHILMSLALLWRCCRIYMDGDDVHRPKLCECEWVVL